MYYKRNTLSLFLFITIFLTTISCDENGNNPTVQGTSNIEWKKIESGTDEFIKNVKILNDNSAFFLAKGKPSHFNLNLFKTTDSGKNWQLYSDTIYDSLVNKWAIYLEALDFISETEGYIISAYKLYKTIDAGQTWSEIQYFTKNDITPIHVNFIDEKVGYVHSNFNIYKTSDGGNSWEIINLPEKQIHYYAFFLNENVGFISTSTKIHKTTNSGSSWSQYKHDAEIYYDSSFIELEDVGTIVYFINEKRGWMYGDYNNFKFKETTDGAKTWKNLPIRNVTDIQFTDEKNGWITTSEGIYYTSNAGKKWNLQLETDKALLKIHMADNNTGIVGGQYGIIYMTE